MFDSPESLLEAMQDIAYVPFTTLMSPEEVWSSKEGSCHDQALLEYDELTDMGFNPIAKFIMSVDAYGQGEETHSFVYYNDNNGWCWIEHAWEDLSGIRVYDSEDALIDSVMFAFGRRNGFDRLYLADFNPDDHTIGEDLSDFVEICMETAEEYKIE